MRLRSLVVALLLVSLLAPASGATYVQGSDIPGPYDGQALLGLAAADQGSPLLAPIEEHSGPAKKYLSNEPNDYVPVPGNDPDRAYAPGDTIGGPWPMAIPVLSTVSADVSSHVDRAPTAPTVASIATGAPSAAIRPQDPYAGPRAGVPPISEPQHTDAAPRGYDASKIGNIVMPLMPIPPIRDAESPGMATTTAGAQGPSNIPTDSPIATQNSGPVKVEDAYCHDGEFRYTLVNTLDHPVEMRYGWHLDNEYNGKRLYSGSRNISLPAGGRVDVVETFTPLYFSDPRFFVMYIEDDAGLVKYTERKSPLEWDYSTLPPVRKS